MWCFPVWAQAETASSEGASGIHITILVALIGLALWANLRGWKRYQLREKLKVYGVKTQAKVISETFAYAAHTSSKQVGYEFHVPNPGSSNERMRVVGAVAARHFPIRLTKGSCFQVIYLPENPKVHEGESFAYTRGLLGWLIFINIYGFGALGVLIIQVCKLSY